MRRALLSQIFLSIGLCGLLFAEGGIADDRREAVADTNVYLVVRGENKKVIVDRIDLPRRLYMKRSSANKKLFQRYVTEYNGKLSDPERFLLAGSVIRADRAGGLSTEDLKALSDMGVKDPNPREIFLVLLPNGKWRPTSGPEVYRLKDDVPNGKEHLILPTDDDSG